MRGLINPISVAIGVAAGNLATLLVLFLLRREIIDWVQRMVQQGY